MALRVSRALFAVRPELEPPFSAAFSWTQSRKSRRCALPISSTATPLPQAIHLETVDRYSLQVPEESFLVAWYRKPRWELKRLMKTGVTEIYVPFVGFTDASWTEGFDAEVDATSASLESREVQAVRPTSTDCVQSSRCAREIPKVV